MIFAIYNLIMDNWQIILVLLWLAILIETIERDYTERR